MSRRLTTVAFFAAAALVVSSAFAQTTPAKKKKKKKHPKPAATTIELDSNAGAPPAASPPPPASTTPTPTETPTGTPTPTETPTETAGADNKAPTEEATPSASAKAEASPSPTTAGAMPWSAALLLGDGFDAAEGFGLGVRGGYTLPMHVYLGVTFIYHLGNSAPVSTRVFYPGLEGGYELTAGPVLLRPYVGFGPVFVHTSFPTNSIGGILEGGGSTVATLFGGWIGGAVVVPFADRFFAGGDLRLVLVSGYTTAGVFLTGGVRF